MKFVPNAEQIARAAMDSINPELTDQYAKTILFLSGQPAAASAMRGATAPEIGSAEYVRRQAAAFSAAAIPDPPRHQQPFPTRWCP